MPSFNLGYSGAMNVGANRKSLLCALCQLHIQILHGVLHFYLLLFTIQNVTNQVNRLSICLDKKLWDKKVKLEIDYEQTMNEFYKEIGWKK